MKRRDFIVKGTTAAGIPLMLNGMNMEAFAEGSMYNELYESLVANDHILVIIQLAGGNDGVNTVIPLDQYSSYYNARTNIAIKEQKILPFFNHPETGFHPAMAEMMEMYKNGNLSVVQSVGYPNPNFSHFRGTDILHTASDYNQVLSTGWLGRSLNEMYPGFPIGYPNDKMKDPIAIQFGSNYSLGLLGPIMQMGYTITDPNNVSGSNVPGDPIPPNTPAGQKLSYLRQVSNQANKYSIGIQDAYTAGLKNFVNYPVGNVIANQLKVIARLIHGGLQTKIYVANMNGFDIHSTQTNGGDNDTGLHATLLSRVSTAVSAFHNDLKIMGKDKRVVGMTVSEFGRRIKSNSSGGTDHGAAAPMFIFGSEVNGGIIGTNPIMPNPPNTDNVPYQYDFRSVYWSILKNWLCQDSPTLMATMLRGFQELPIIKDSACTAPAPPKHVSGQNLIEAYPNPVVNSTVIELKVINPGHVLVQMLSSQGRVIRTVYENQREPVGVIRKTVTLSGFQLGIYYIRFQSGFTTQMKAIIKVN